MGNFWNGKPEAGKTTSEDSLYFRKGKGGGGAGSRYDEQEM